MSLAVAVAAAKGPPPFLDVRFDALTGAKLDALDFASASPMRDATVETMAPLSQVFSLEVLQFSNPFFPLSLEHVLLAQVTSLVLLQSKSSRDQVGYQLSSKFRSQLKPS